MDLAFIDAETAGRCADDPSQVIPLLQAVQEQRGYVPEAALREIATLTGAPESEVFSVVTFYKQFRLRPPGRHVLKVCDGTACHVMGSPLLLEVLLDELKLGAGDTTEDGLFTVTPVACLGCCSLAPVLMVDGETHGGLDAPKLRRLLKDCRRRA